MPEFLLEVGCEELPASFVEKAYNDLRDALCKELTDLGVCEGGATACGTPRRLIVSFPNLKPRQEDSVKEQRGPSLQAAYDAAGEPTKALLGFCKSQGIEPSDLRKDEQYVWVTKHVSGRPTSELLESILPRIILGLNFEKSMRWGASRARFARPIRWILAACDGRALDFNVEGVPSALISYGHRFYAPDPFEAKNFFQLVDELRDRFVEPLSSIRRGQIVEQAHLLAHNCTIGYDDLLDENTFLTEWPTAILGSFSESYLELPEPVLVTAMAKHERMFPVRETDTGKLTNQFIFIRNSGEDETVRKGCEWVLGARFNDARFFYEQDQKLTLDDFLAKTEGVVFQAQLGSVRQRAARLANLGAKLAKMFNFSPEEVEMCRKVGLYSKADLATGLVSELSSLQGFVGGFYLRKEGQESDRVCWTIENQYSRFSLAESHEDIQTAWYSAYASRAENQHNLLPLFQLSDNLDKLAGYLGLGLSPSGSSDPFGLRRCVTALIENAILCPEIQGFSHVELISVAAAEYDNQGYSLDSDRIISTLADMHAARYPVLWSSSKTRRPFEAALMRGNHQEMTNPKRVLFRLETLEQFDAPADLQTIARPINLSNSATSKGEKVGSIGEITQLGLNSEEGRALLDSISLATPEVESAKSPLELATILKSLLPAINAFFDNTMVMSDDPTERFHRLSLASATADLFLVAGDFTKLEG
jgi:glycyl-tRNA synthetase beta chain